MTYPEYFKAKKVKARNLATYYQMMYNYYESEKTKKSRRIDKLSKKQTELKDQLHSSSILLHQKIGYQVFGPALFTFGMLLKMPYVGILGFVGTHAQEHLEHYNLSSKGNIRFRDVSEIKDALGYAESLLENFKQEKNASAYCQLLLKDIIDNLNKEAAFWGRLEELALIHDPLQEVSLLAIENGTRISSVLRGDMFPETFGEVPDTDEGLKKSLCPKVD